MLKFIKKIFIGLLVMVLPFTLAGCGTKYEVHEPKAERKYEKLQNRNWRHVKRIAPSIIKKDSYYDSSTKVSYGKQTDTGSYVIYFYLKPNISKQLNSKNAKMMRSVEQHTSNDEDQLYNKTRANDLIVKALQTR